MNRDLNWPTLLFYRSYWNTPPPQRTEQNTKTSNQWTQ